MIVQSKKWNLISLTDESTDTWLLTHDDNGMTVSFDYIIDENGRFYFHRYNHGSQLTISTDYIPERMTRKLREHCLYK